MNLVVFSTPEQRSNGLMNVHNLPKDSGALFVFDSDDYLYFWGKNTYIDLDIAFLDSDFVITQISSIYKHNLKSVSSYQRCRYAVEMNAGWFERNSIQVGNRLDIHHSIPYQKMEE